MPHLSKAMPSLDAIDTETRAQLEIVFETPAVFCDLERTAASDEDHVAALRGRDLGTSRGLVCDEPAAHRQLQEADQMAALLDVAHDGRDVVAGIERAGEWGKVRNAKRTH